MICPGLLVNRPASVTNLSAAYYNNLVSSDPLLYSYQGCTCASPLTAYYYNDTSGDLESLMYARCCMASLACNPKAASRAAWHALVHRLSWPMARPACIQSQHNLQMLLACIYTANGTRLDLQETRFACWQAAE